MRKAGWMAALAALALGTAPAGAQVRSVDPNQAIDQDLQGPRTAPRPEPGYPDQRQPVDAPQDAAPPAPATSPDSAPAREQRADRAQAADATFHRDDLIGAGEGVFGKGAQGLAGIVEKILKNQGEPNAYIAGREASGAIVLGLRYGSGVMTHKVEGQRPVYWTGPSVGFDLGGDANKVFVLVYNLYDTEELFKRFPQGEGHLYAVGGFSASYLRRGHVVLIPVRLGVGWRAGVNVGYMKFTKNSKWLPF